MPDSSPAPLQAARCHTLFDTAARRGLAQRDLDQIERLGYAGLPVCIAKTQHPLSDDPHRRRTPVGFDVSVCGIQINAGAGFPVVLTGDILLPRHPLAAQVDLRDGSIVGLR